MRIKLKSKEIDLLCRLLREDTKDEYKSGKLLDKILLKIYKR